jgi:hypothetical protein
MKENSRNKMHKSLRGENEMTCKMLANYKKERGVSIYVKYTKYFAR